MMRTIKGMERCSEGVKKLGLFHLKRKRIRGVMINICKRMNEVEKANQDLLYALM